LYLDVTGDENGGAEMGWQQHGTTWRCDLPDGTSIEVLEVGRGWIWEHFRPAYPVPPTAAGTAGMAETLGAGEGFTSAGDAIQAAIQHGLKLGYT
jgi:hypothetical protein